MKKLIYLLALPLLLGSSLFAQKLNFGLKLGITGSVLTETNNGNNLGNTASINNVDVRACLNINYENITIQPGLGLFLKGGFGDAVPSFTSGGSYVLRSTELRLTYIEVPINVLYNIPIKPGKFFIGTGPYIALAASGKNTTYTTSIGPGGSIVNSKDESGVNFGSGQNQVKMFDLGVNTLGGFRFNNGIDIGAEYSFGLTSIYNISGFSAKNISTSFTIGYFFK